LVLTTSLFVYNDFIICILFRVFTESLRNAVAVEAGKAEVAITQRQEIESLVKEQRETIVRLQKSGAISSSRGHGTDRKTSGFEGPVDEIIAELAWLRHRQQAIEAKSGS
jgi:hypothetical protein